MTISLVRPGLIMAVTALCAASAARSGPPAYVDADFFLKAFAKRIASAGPGESDSLALKVDIVGADDSLRVNCRLTNISGDAVVIDRLNLPCAGWWSLEILGVTTDAHVLPKSTSAGSIAHSLTPREITIHPGETVKGNMPLQSVYPLSVNPRNEDVLLLWAYSYDGHVLTGIALLPRKR
jgi:hypothetical protein